MAECPSGADQALKKLADQLTCPVCLETYTTPKLLQCFHVFCEECLQKLTRQGQHGSLTCPNCRQATKIPPNGVPALQPAFHIHHLAEIRDALEKMKTPQHMKCEKCKRRNATSYCRDCGNFICPVCTEVHETWQELSSHEVISLDQLEGDVTKLVPPKKTVSYCPKHKGKELELYCETCGELICHNCTVRLHQGHQYDLVADTFQKHKEELVASLKPVEQHLGTVEKALVGLDGRCQQISDQRNAMEATIHKTIRQLQESLEVRKTELINQLGRLTQQKLKNLATQRDQFELIQTRLSSCLEFVNESLRTGSEGEVLGMRKPVVKQIEEVTAESQPKVLVPKERANLKFSCNAELQAACQHFGEVRISPVFPENCYVAGKALEVARVGEEATAILYAMDTEGQECEEPIEDMSCELVPCQDGPTVKCSVKKMDKSKYEIRYSPTTRGQHQLHIKVEGEHVKGSPFNLIIKIEKFGTPIMSIGGFKRPWRIAVNERGEVIVVERYGHCVSILSPQGEKITKFGTRGSAPGQFNVPKGVALDRDGNILVSDFSNHRVQKFSPDGKFIKSVGRQGKGPLQFEDPSGIGISQNGRIYVCDRCNHHVQVLNSDLTYHSSFGSRGSDNGQFQFPWDVAVDSRGNVYVADSGNNCIQVFTGDGQFLRKFGKEGSGEGELNFPAGITIDSDDMVYVTERDNHCVSVFTGQGQFVRTFGAQGTGPGQFQSPCGIESRNGVLCISDSHNDRLQVF